MGGERAIEETRHRRRDFEPEGREGSSEGDIGSTSRDGHGGRCTVNGKGNENHRQ
jgi:hypothetical protein